MVACCFSRRGERLLLSGAAWVFARPRYADVEHSAGLQRRIGEIRQEDAMLKVIGWVVAIIFLIGLLVVFGVIDLIF